MEDQILDSDFSSSERIKKPSLWQWSIIITLWLCLLYSISEGLIIYPKIIASTVLLIIATLTSIKSWKIGTMLTLMILILATFNIISFLPITETFSIHIGWFGFGFEKKFLLLLLAHLFLNKSWFSLGESYKMSEEEVQADFQSKANRFVEKFASKSDLELEMIIENGSLINEAREAARQVLNSRKNIEK